MGITLMLFYGVGSMKELLDLLGGPGPRVLLNEFIRLFGDIPGLLG